MRSVCEECCNRSKSNSPFGLKHLPAIQLADLKDRAVFSDRCILRVIFAKSYEISHSIIDDCNEQIVPHSCICNFSCGNQEVDGIRCILMCCWIKKSQGCCSLQPSNTEFSLYIKDVDSSGIGSLQTCCGCSWRTLQIAEFQARWPSISQASLSRERRLTEGQGIQFFTAITARPYHQYRHSA